VQEQQATMAQLKSTAAQQQRDFQATIAQLAKRADEQASQLQRVSAQLEVNRQMPRVVSSNQ
jgi:16S rRNA G1207 methylase RsmC